MDIRMLVARVSSGEFTTTVDLNGAKIEAKIPQLEVELVDESGQFGAITMRFRSEEERAFAAKFVQGEHTTITI